MATQVTHRPAVIAPLAARWGVLPSRVAPPVSRSSDVLRDGLVSSLVASPGPIVSVIAPSGYGKSTLMAQFVERDPRRSAWLSVGPDADDPVTIARYLALALDQVVPVGDDVLQELDGLHPRVRIATAGLAAAIQGADEPIGLVVDDIHLLNDRRCFALLRSIAGELSPGSIAAFVARHETPLPLARARAAGDLLEVGVDDLRLRPADAAELLRAAGAVDVGPDDALRLTEQMEGWAVGLYLAGRAFATAPGAAAPSFGGDDRFVADYIRETMLAELPAADVDFLIQTSVLHELSGPLCDAALETKGSGAKLEWLEASNLLVVPLDHRRERFRYHHLFGDHLRQELERRAPELVQIITGRASTWCEQQGLTDEAVAYAIAGGHIDRVAEMIDRHAQAAYYGGRAGVVRSWLAWFGEHAELSRFPMVAVLGAWLQAAEGHPIEAERWIDAIPAGDDEDPGGATRAIGSLLLAAMTRSGPEQMLVDTERGASLLPTVSSWHPNGSLLEGLALMCLGETESASESFRRAADLAAELGVAIARALAHAEITLIALQAGDLKEAATHIATSRRIVDEGKLQGYPTTALTYAVDARVALVRGDPVRARSSAQDAAALDPGVSYAIPIIGLQTALSLVRCAMGLGDIRWAESSLERANDVVAHRPDLGNLVFELDAAREEVAKLRASAVGAPSLTPAEARLLPLLTTHLSFREIGGELFLSPHTVKTQAISIYRKFGVSSRGEAIRVAREIGLLTP